MSQRLSSKEDLVFCVRELLRVKSTKNTKTFLIMTLRNTLYLLSFTILGLIIITITRQSWNTWLLVNETDIPILGFTALILFWGSFFLKSMLTGRELLNQVNLDRTTVETLRSEDTSVGEIIKTLSSVIKHNPMVMTTKGYDLRKTTLSRLYPVNKAETPKKISWEDL